MPSGAKLTVWNVCCASNAVAVLKIAAVKRFALPALCDLLNRFAMAVKFVFRIEAISMRMKTLLWMGYRSCQVSGRAVTLIV
jgi:hypothetical protein